MKFFLIYSFNNSTIHGQIYNVCIRIFSSMSPNPMLKAQFLYSKLFSA